MKIPRGRSVEKIVEEQIQQWQMSRAAARVKNLVETGFKCVKQKEC